jgi:hypothetical protein
MKDLGLGIVLYITYFSAACWWIKDPKKREEKPQPITPPTPQTSPTQAPEAIEEQPKVELNSLEDTTLYNLALQEIKGLSKRKARKLCKPLGIQQKRNGVEISQEMMIGFIIRKFRENPDRVISVIHQQLPGLLPEDETEAKQVS